MKLHLHTRLQASAMSYTLVVCLLIGTMLSGMVLVFGLEKTAGNAEWFQELAHDNLQSGLNLALYGPDTEQESWQLFGSELDSVFVHSKVWGLYGLISVKSKHGPAQDSATYLFGQRPQNTFAANLFLSDLNKPLFLAGRSRLQGDLYLPQSGVRRGRIGNKGFLLPQFYEGVAKKSTGNRCTPDYSRVKETQQVLGRVWLGEYDGTGVVSEFLPGKVLIAPELHIPADAQFDHALLFANRIYIASGFKGRIQAFATDTLTTGKDCQFDYPSVLLVSNPEHNSLLHLGSGSQLEGMLINDPSFLNEPVKSGGYTLIDSSCKIFGTVHIPFNLDLRGAVHGHVSTFKFLRRSPGSSYDNHLMDARIGPQGLSPDYAMGLIQPGPPSPLLIEEFLP